MGMYDYVGKSGDQVKCFYLPCFSVRNFNKETKTAECSFHVVGGRLASANNAPYVTPYYNYGKDFAILDYAFYESETPQIHFFRDGKWVRSADYDRVSDRYQYPPVTIDKYGEYINIKSAKEMKQFVDEFIKMDKTQTQMMNDALEAVNLSSRIGSIDHYRSMGIDAMNAEFRLRDQIRNEVYANTFAIFSQKWFNKNKSNLDLIGMIIYDYMDEQKEERDGYRTTDRLEYEWYALFAGVVDLLKSEYENPVEEYFKWCDCNHINIDKEQVKSLFEKYTQNPNDDIIAEFERKIENLPF